MTQIRRAANLFFRGDDRSELSVESLLLGRLEVGPRPRLRAISPLTGDETVLTPDELETLLAFSDREWTDASGHDPLLVEAFARRGLVITDEGDDERRELRRRDEQLAAGFWHPHAALFHAATSWRDVTVDTSVELEPFRDGEPPPPHFHEVERAHGVRELPLPRDLPLGRVLGARRTTRAFDVDAALAEDDLATLLHLVFGCHGTARLGGDHLALRRTSPSGGALHPIEAYPLVRAVDGVDPGLYHYRTRDHALELLVALEGDEALELGDVFTCGQTYLAQAHVVFVLTARFERSFWKYRRHERAYGALLVEVGHFSQTLYLVAAELGLGAFVTAAINGANIEERLGLDALAEGPLAICGCGIPSRRATEVEPRFEPYVPPR